MCYMVLVISCLSLSLPPPPTHTHTTPPPPPPSPPPPPLLQGTVEFTAEVLENGAASFDLDTRDLKIKGAAVEGKSVQWSFAKAHEALGTRLSIPLDAALRIKGKKLTITIDYRQKFPKVLCMVSFTYYIYYVTHF